MWRKEKLSQGLRLIDGGLGIGAATNHYYLARRTCFPSSPITHMEPLHYNTCVHEASLLVCFLPPPPNTHVEPLHYNTCVHEASLLACFLPPPPNTHMESLHQMIPWNGGQLCYYLWSFLLPPTHTESLHEVSVVTLALNILS